jgi:hypothetical protein
MKFHSRLQEHGLVIVKVSINRDLRLCASRSIRQV